ncbi:MAG: M28 family peptidase [Armatimonadota bacterium]|nr:M28 family peptidase [Armatimonadota bacterium]
MNFRKSHLPHFNFFLVIHSLIIIAVTGCSAQNTPPRFDADRAFFYLQKQCDFGPRPVGSPAHEKLKAYLIAELKKCADSVQCQDFVHNRFGKTYKLSNIIANFGKLDSSAILLCAHWDTRPTADQEIELNKRSEPILGANDGASGVAVLLELARLFNERPPPVPIVIVLFDGEDFGPTSEHMFLGSQYFAKNVKKETFRYGILLDMVGDKELTIYREKSSNKYAKRVVDRVWTAAAKLGYSKVFIDQEKYNIIDDHIPLNKKGIPCIDVIDFDYAYWHTLQDTVDKCSSISLRIVGETIASVVYSEPQNWQ